MEILPQLLISGLLTGGIYSLMALAIVIVYKASGVYNFAYGALVALGCFLCWSFLVQFGWPLWATIISLLVIAFLLGWLIERLILSPMTGQSHLSIVMATLGLNEILAGVLVLFWPGLGRWLPALPFASTLDFFGIPVSVDLLISFGISMVLFVGFLLFQRTNLGLAMRAVAEDHQTARSAGIRVETVFGTVWIASIIMAAAAGIFLGLKNGVSMSIADLGMKAFPAVVFGGLESIVGALLGGFVVAILENLGGAYLDPFVGGGMKEIIPFVVLLIVLIVKPYGFFGYKRIERI